MLCYRGSLCQLVRLCPLWARPPFLPKAMHNFGGWAMWFGITCWMFITFLLSFFFFLFTFLSPLCIISRSLSQLWRVWFPCNFLFLMWWSLQMWFPIIGLFIFKFLGFLCPVVAPGQIMCARCLLLCKNSRLLLSYCVKWPFSYPVWGYTFPRFYPISWQNVSQVSSDFLF